MSISLYQISAELTRIEDMVAEADGVLSPELDAYIMDQLAIIGEAQADKADGYVGLIRKVESIQSAAKAEAERYSRIAKIQENFSERLKDRLKQYMQDHGIKRIDTVTGRTIRLQANGGKPSVQYAQGLQAADVPMEFQKQTIAVDTVAVRNALEAGRKLEFATLGERGESLRIT